MAAVQLILLAGLLMGTQGPRADLQHNGEPAPYPIDAMDFKTAGLIDRLCIVRSIGRTRDKRLVGDASDGTGKLKTHDVSLERGLVLDGPGKGTTVSLVTADPPEASALPNEADPKARLACALVDALPAAHGWDRERLVTFLTNSRGFGYGVGVCDEGPLATKLRQIAERTNDSILRVDAYGLFLVWRVKGFEGRLYTALMDAAGSDYTGELPSSSSFVKHLLPNPLNYKIEYDRKRCNFVAATAKNDTIRHYLFQYAAGSVTREDKVRFVKMLDWEDPSFVDNVMFRRLADWDDLPDKKPVWVVRSSISMREVANRDELIAFWKARYRS